MEDRLCQRKEEGVEADPDGSQVIPDGQRGLPEPALEPPAVRIAAEGTLADPRPRRRPRPLFKVERTTLWRALQRTVPDVVELSA
jgi:hypothetical protein